MCSSDLVLIAAEKARDSLQAAELEVLKSASGIVTLCAEMKNISQSLVMAANMREENHEALNKKLQKISGQQF